MSAASVDAGEPSMQRGLCAARQREIALRAFGKRCGIIDPSLVRSEWPWTLMRLVIFSGPKRPIF